MLNNISSRSFEHKADWRFVNALRQTAERSTVLTADSSPVSFGGTSVESNLERQHMKNLRTAFQRRIACR
jgi:hypothetical protein